MLVIEHTADPEAGSLTEMAGDQEKVTIRLPAQLKQALDLAAASRGVSVNTWCVWTLARSISRQTRRELAGEPGAVIERRRGRRRGGRRASIDAQLPDTGREGDQEYA